LAHPPHDLRVRHLQHLGGERVGDLVLHQLRCLPRPFRHDDHLHVRQVGNGIHGSAQHRPEPRDRQRGGGEQNEQPVRDGPFDDSLQHGGLTFQPPACPCRACQRPACPCFPSSRPTCPSIPYRPTPCRSWTSWSPRGSTRCPGGTAPT